MIVFPNAKINLGLKVLKKRADGYHDIQTVFYPIPLHDVLEAVPSPDGVFRFTSSGNVIPSKTEDNLCVRAYHLINNAFGISPVHMHLHKVIPSGAGMGGGSSDAASALILLNALYELGIEEPRLMNYASQLGSDCAFFVRNIPSFAEGRGEIITNVPVRLSGYNLIIIKPPFFVSTALAYTLVIPSGKPLDPGKIAHESPDKWKGFLANDFESAIFSKYPGLKRIKDELYSSGALYASMSGSGSAMYGIFPSKMPDLTDQFPNCFVWQSMI
jgi:4-diphosphocytidyl-2-C-methyl-D-erythritol kinase